MKSTVYQTSVRIDLPKLREVVVLAEEAYNKIGTRETSQGRSAFSAWNNMNKFLQSVDLPQGARSFITIPVNATVDNEACARIYNSPSVTSLAKDFRKCIVPLNENNKFLFFDLRAAEFFLYCYFAGETSVIEPYLQGQDPYKNLSRFFPEGTTRGMYKLACIASLYGATPYTLTKMLDMSEAYAARLLDCVDKALPKLTKFKQRVIEKAQREGFYVYPTDLNQTHFNKVPYKKSQVTKRVEFNPNVALSVYTQSGLGYFMQRMVEQLPKEGTLLTVFDSVLLELPPDKIESAIASLRVMFKPFYISEFKVGSNFYECM